MDSMQQGHLKTAQEFEGTNRLDEAILEYRKSIEAGFSQEACFRLIQLLRQTQKWHELIEIAGSSLKSIPEDNLFFRNILLNELEIAQKKTVLESRIRSFTVTLTNRCNLKCLACEARRYGWDMPESIMEEITGHLPYLEYIMWQGGEVFLLDYFKDILEQARHYPQIKQLIVTNGMLLSPGIIETLVNLPDIVLAVSIDGTTRDVYEKIRRGADFGRLLDTINDINRARSLQPSNLRLHMNVTVMRSNYHQILDFIEFARTHRFYSILFRPVQGNKDSDENIFIRRDKEVDRFIIENMDKAASKASGYGIILDNRIPDMNPALPGQAGLKAVNPGLLCYAPWQRLYISWGGNVYPDCMCVWPQDRGVANVDRDSIRDIWNNEGMQLYRQRLIDNDYRDICSQDCVSGNVPQRYLLFNK